MELRKSPQKGESKIRNYKLRKNFKKTFFNLFQETRVEVLRKFDKNKEEEQNRNFCIQVIQNSGIKWITPSVLENSFKKWKNLNLSGEFLPHRDILPDWKILCDETVEGTNISIKIVKQEYPTLEDIYYILVSKDDNNWVIRKKLSNIWWRQKPYKAEINEQWDKIYLTLSIKSWFSTNTPEYNLTYELTPGCTKIIDNN